MQTVHKFESAANLPKLTDRSHKCKSGSSSETVKDNDVTT